MKKNIISIPCFFRNICKQEPLCYDASSAINSETKMSLRIVFAGTPQLAALVLEKLLNSEHEIIAVYTQPDRPAGRGCKITASPVKQLALENNVAVYQPINFKDKETIDTLQQLKPDVMVVVAYGLLLPKAVLDIPKYGCLNIHPSLLPRWRGPAPVLYSLLHGEDETGVTVMQLDEGMDSGPIFKQQHEKILTEDNCNILNNRLFKIGGELLLQVLSEIEQAEIQPVPQNNKLASYSKKINKEMAQIGWSLAADEIHNRVRAFNPWPIAFTFFHGGPLRIYQSEIVATDSAFAAGTIVQASQSGLVVATGRGMLRLLQVQLPGKKPVSAADFVNAHREQIVEGETVLG
jgi:methionyl-tRNA formyltransferase